MNANLLAAQKDRQGIIDLLYGFEFESKTETGAVVVNGGFVTPENFSYLIKAPELKELKEALENGDKLLVLKAARNEVRYFDGQEVNKVLQEGYKPEMTRAYILVPRTYREIALRADSFGTDIIFSHKAGYESMSSRKGFFETWLETKKESPVQTYTDWGDKPLPCNLSRCKDFEILGEQTFWSYIDARDFQEVGYEYIGRAYKETVKHCQNIADLSVQAMLDGNYSYFELERISIIKGKKREIVILNAPLMNEMANINESVDVYHRYRFILKKTSYPVELIVESLISSGLIGINTVSLLLVDEKESKMMFITDMNCFEHVPKEEMFGVYVPGEHYECEVSGTYPSKKYLLNAKERFLKALEEAELTLDGKMVVPVFTKQMREASES